jgi:3',5'-cyclic AMP phosphodiesterase CpdA
VPTAPFLATGRLGAAQLARLGELLDECAQTFRVVLIHHPPLSRPARRFKRLIDGAALRAVLARHGAELVLHGHDHERAFLLLAGAGHPIAVAGAPSATEALPGGPDRPGYNLYRIDPKARRCEALVRGIEADGDGAVEIERRLILG